MDPMGKAYQENLSPTLIDSKDRTLRMLKFDGAGFEVGLIQGGLLHITPKGV